LWQRQHLLGELRCIWESEIRAPGLAGDALEDAEVAVRNHSPHVVAVGGAGNGVGDDRVNTYHDALDERNAHCRDAHGSCCGPWEVLGGDSCSDAFPCVAAWDSNELRDACLAVHHSACCDRVVAAGADGLGIFDALGDDGVPGHPLGDPVDHEALVETALDPVVDAAAVEALAVVAAVCWPGLLVAHSWQLEHCSRMHFYSEGAAIVQWQQLHPEECEAFGLDDGVVAAAEDDPEVPSDPFHSEVESYGIAGDESYARAVAVAACDAACCSFRIDRCLACRAEQDIAQRDEPIPVAESDGCCFPCGDDPVPSWLPSLDLRVLRGDGGDTAVEAACDADFLPLGPEHRSMDQKIPSKHSKPKMEGVAHGADSPEPWLCLSALLLPWEVTLKMC